MATLRFKRLSPILKNNTELTDLQEQNSWMDFSDFSSFAPDDKAAANSVKESSNQRKSSLPCVTKNDFVNVCLKATDDFIVVKEIITNSTTLNSSTSFTLRTRESLSGTNKIAVTMNRFYTSKTLPEHSLILPEFKIGTTFLQMVI